MDTLQLFTERVPELEALPSQPRVYWYPSAGKDFRGCVAFTDYRIQHEKKHHGRKYSKPNLYVYNCLGAEVLELKEKLSQGDVVLWNDQSTRIMGKNYRSLQLRNDVNFEINPDYIDTENMSLNDFETDRAFYFELEISGLNYSETQKILYFEAENIDFFNQIILTNIFQTKYLCATREGLAWGNCKKSIIDYIYLENEPHFFTDHGFMPSFNILFNDYTKEMFVEAVRDSFSVVPYYGKFISESDDFTDDSVIYKLCY